jgi:hypothetical protein
MISKPFVRRVGRLTRDFWIAIGIALLMVVGAELLYRGQAGVRSMLRSDPEQERPSHPYDGEAWWEEWSGGAARWAMRFDPYRALWARPGQSKYVNIDSLGRRATTDPAPQVPKSAMVYMFGGSAMWGYTARDPQTIPSLVAEELARRGRPDVGVVNYAQPAFNLTQGVNTLVLELRSRRAPSVAVFMDGNNEIAPPFQSGRVGTILNEEAMDRRLTGPQRGVADALMGHILLAQRLGQLFQEPVKPFVGDQRLCPEIAEQYFALAAIARSLGREFQFHTIFFWQPMYATTGKRLTEWERSIAAAGGTDGGRWRSTVMECTKAVDGLARTRGIDDYHPLHDLFDDETASVFIDDYGHVVESANRKVAAVIVDRVLDRLPLPQLDR